MKNLLYTLVLAAILLHSEILKASEVLPGDCNKNGIVELVDFLFWGLASGNSGAERTNATTDCALENGIDWSVEINGVNGKHQDADGNGIVDVNDLHIVAGNYGCSLGNPGAPLLNRDNAVFEIVEHTTIIEGETAHIFEIYVTNVEEVNGLAFSFDYNNISYGINENSITVDTDGSWLEATELIVIHDTEVNKMDIAFASNQPVQPPQNQPACKIIIIEDFIGGKPLALNIKIINGVSLNSIGKTTNFENTSFTKTTLDQNIGNTIANSHTTFSTYISSTDQISVEFFNSLAEHAACLNVHSINGVLLMTNKIILQPGENTMEIDTNNFVQGMYVVSLNSSELSSYSEKCMIRK